MIVALETYDEKTVAAIGENEAISGAVMGDPFCNYRMFPGGAQEMEARMRQMKAAGKGVYYQTPCYLTDERLEDTVQKIRYWNSIKLLDGVLLQDVGLLHILGREKTGLELIWSYLGIARNGAVNLLSCEFLQSLAPAVIATDRPGRYRAMKEHGIPAIWLYGKITYSTMNRLCYYTYENNLYGKDCGRACLAGRQRMVNGTFQMEMSVDGYMLGKKYIYTESDLEPGILYAKDYEECLARIAGKRGTK